jgi:hypothetical protein
MIGEVVREMKPCLVEYRAGKSLLMSTDMRKGVGRGVKAEISCALW